MASSLELKLFVTELFFKVDLGSFCLFSDVSRPENILFDRFDLPEVLLPDFDGEYRLGIQQKNILLR
jgi:hypothetical protein